MAFPNSPSDGQQTTVSNVTYQYNSAKTAWYRIGTVANPITSTVDYYTGNGVQTTFSLSAVPATEDYTFVAVGGVLQPRNTYSLAGSDLIFSGPPPNLTPVEITTFGGSGGSAFGNNSVGIYLQHYTGNISAGNVSSGGYFWANGEPFVSSNYGDANVNSYITGTTFTDIYADNLWITSNLVAYSNINIQGNVLPLASDIYNLGSPTQRFKSIYLAGNTIDLAGTTISTAANGAILMSASIIVTGNIINSAGVDLTSYVNTLNAAQTANVTAANTAIVTANSSMKSYVDNQIIASGGYSNVALASYLATNDITVANITGGGVRSTSSGTAPASPSVGDIWFDTTDNVLYRYTSDGTRKHWLDISGPVYTFDWQSNVSFAGNLMPAANVTYQIGNESQRYVSLYVNQVNSSVITNTGTATVGNVITTNGVFWSNGNAYSGGSSGITTGKAYGLSVLFGPGY
jgi:hypothetical protein